MPISPSNFSDEEIIELGLFCAEADGVGKFVKSLNVMSWEEACELNPKLLSRNLPSGSRVREAQFDRWAR